MIRLQLKNNQQIITEICDKCICFIRDLSVNDILTKPKALENVTVKDSDGNEVTRTEPRDKCYCEHCDHD